MSTTINHGQMSQIDENGNINVFYPKTFSDDVYVDSNGTTLSTKLTNIDTAISGKTNTAVKGNAESSYRTGNVNITPANIGLGNVNNTADANKSVNYANSAGSASTAGTATYAQNATGNLANALNSKINVGTLIGNWKLIESPQIGTSEVVYNLYKNRSFASYDTTESMFILMVLAAGWIRSSAVTTVGSLRAQKQVSIEFLSQGSMKYVDFIVVNDTQVKSVTSAGVAVFLHGYVLGV